MRALLLIVAALISYGSLYPFSFAAHEGSLEEILALVTSPDLSMSRGDLVGNLLLFAPYGFLASLQARDHRRPAFTLTWILLAGAALALALQIAQIWLPSRVPSLADAMVNVVGMAGGVAIAAAASQLMPRGKSLHASSTLVPAALMLCWLGYQWFPLVPTLDLQNVRNAVKPLFLASGLDWVRTLHATVAWSAFFMLAGKLFATAIRPTVLAAAGIVVLLAKLFIVGASISLTNALGLGLALTALPWLRRPASLNLLIIAMLLSLLLSGLAPFALASIPGSFHWIPFTGMLGGNMERNLLVLLEKTYLYGSLIFFITLNGARPIAAASAVALCLGFIEGVQVFLPGRTAETTDPVWAIILGFLIQYSMKSRSGRK